MGLFDRLTPNYYRQQLQRKRNVFADGKEATLTGVLTYMNGKQATGKVVYARLGYGGHLIATTKRLKSQYQGARMPGAAKAEAGRLSHPINQTVSDIRKAYAHDHKVLAAVDLYVRNLNGFDQILDTPGMRKALKVLAPLEREIRQARLEGRHPKALRFNEVPEVRTIPARVVPPSTAQPAVAPQPVPTAPLSGEAVEPAVGQKLDIRARVAAMSMKFRQKDKPDLMDAHRLLTTYRKHPERIEDPLRTLLILADEHAAKRTETVGNAWNMDGVGSINEGLEVLLNTPVLLMLKGMDPEQFEALCRCYDGLKD